MNRAGFLLVEFLGLSLAAADTAQSAALNLIGESVSVFSEQWREQGFPLIRATEYEAHEVGGQVVVTGRSIDANRAMLREIKVKEPRVANLRWRWRARGELPETIDERSKRGDDFAARVFVVFETSMLPTRTRSINYVWSVNDAPEEIFSSPSPGTLRTSCCAMDPVKRSRLSGMRNNGMSWLTTKNSLANRLGKYPG